MPSLAATTVWGWVFDTQYGVVNNLLTALTGDRWFGHSWLLDPLSFFVILTCIVVWGAVPVRRVHAVRGPHPDPGGGHWRRRSSTAPARFQRFRLIQLPYVRSILTVLVVLSVIWDLSVFTQVFVLQASAATAS